MAFLAKLEKTTDGLELQTMADKGAPNIHRYMNYTSNEGYIYIIIENRDQEAIYIEELEFDKFEKLQMLKPHSGEKFKVQVGSESTEIILIKALRGADFAMGYHNMNVVLGNHVLR